MNRHHDPRTPATRALHLAAGISDERFLELSLRYINLAVEPAPPEPKAAQSVSTLQLALRRFRADRRDWTTRRAHLIAGLSDARFLELQERYPIASGGRG